GGAAALDRRLLLARARPDRHLPRRQRDPLHQHELRVPRGGGRARVQPGIAGAGVVRPRAAAGGHGADASRAHRRCTDAAAGGVRAVRFFGVAVVVLLLVASDAWAAPLQRFFVMGDGTLAVVNAHTGERAEVRYRKADGTYDQ